MALDLNGNELIEEIDNLNFSFKSQIKTSIIKMR